MDTDLAEILSLGRGELLSRLLYSNEAISNNHCASIFEDCDDDELRSLLLSLPHAKQAVSSLHSSMARDVSAYLDIPIEISDALIESNDGRLSPDLWETLMLERPSDRILNFATLLVASDGSVVCPPEVLLRQPCLIVVLEDGACGARNFSTRLWRNDPKHAITGSAIVSVPGIGVWHLEATSADGEVFLEQTLNISSPLFEYVFALECALDTLQWSFDPARWSLELEASLCQLLVVAEEELIPVGD